MDSTPSPRTTSADLRYLDLVDTSNGNAYVTTDGEITLYWPYPDGTDRNSEFQLVHYAGLDRNSNTDLEQGNYTMELYSTEDGTLVATDEGIRFTVDSFSPFALFWEDEDDDDDRDDDDDDDDDDDRGHGGSGGTPQLNKEDHFAYVSGYPDGTVQPNDPITREEVATIFFRLLTDASRADYITVRNPFPDVESSRWSFYSITTLNNGGIMTGRTGGDFDPGAYITVPSSLWWPPSSPTPGTPARTSSAISPATGPGSTSTAPPLRAGSPVIPTAPTAPTGASPALRSWPSSMRCWTAPPTPITCWTT